MGAYPKFQKRSEIGGYALQDTAVGVRRNPYLGCFRPKHGKRKAGRPTITYTDVLQQDTGLETTDMRTAMLNRSVWRAITVGAQVSTEASKQAKQFWNAIHVHAHRESLSFPTDFAEFQNVTLGENSF